MARAMPMMFAFALFLLIGAVHVLATIKIGAIGDLTAVDEATAKHIRLVATISKHVYIGVGYCLLCLFLIWFTAFRRYPLWAGWLVLATLAAPWVIYLKACGMVIHRLSTG